MEANNMDATATRSLQHHPGFTLIEVLVVVAIIALLISILLPSLAAARDRAQAAVCMSNMKQLGNAHYYFSQDNNGMLPSAIYWVCYRTSEQAKDIRTPESGELWGIKYQLNGVPNPTPRKNYAVTPDIAKCPSDKGNRKDDPIAQIYAIRPPNFSYSRNGHIGNALYPMSGPNDPAATEKRNRQEWTRFSDPRRPSDTPLLLEEYEYAPMNDGVFRLRAPWESLQLDKLTMRHARRANIAHYDMHVSAVLGQSFNDPDRDNIEEESDLPPRHAFLAPGFRYPW